MNLNTVHRELTLDQLTKTERKKFHCIMICGRWILPFNIPAAVMSILTPKSSSIFFAGSSSPPQGKLIKIGVRPHVNQRLLSCRQDNLFNQWPGVAAAFCSNGGPVHPYGHTSGSVLGQDAAAPTGARVCGEWTGRAMVQ
jgi:hypothetical protein